MNQRILFSIIGIFGILAVAIMYLALSDDTPNQKDDEIATTQDASEGQQSGGPQLKPLGDGKNDMVQVIEDPVEELEYYQEWARFPPHSRPLHEGQADLLDPYNTERPALGVLSKRASGCVKTENGPRCSQPAEFSKYTCSLQPESAISVGKPDFKVYVWCHDDKGRRQPLSFTVAKVYTKVDRKTSGSLTPIAQGDTGSDGDEKANDKIYTFVIRPTTRDWGYMFLELDMEINGHKHNQRTNWYSTPHEVAKFQQSTTSKITDGHLVVSKTVQIDKAGYYNFDANLQGTRGEKKFIATASFEGDLVQGVQQIPFQFWGKIIREAGVDGPYLVRNIRGRRNNSPVTPSMVKKATEENRPLTGEHTEPMWEHILPAEDYTTGKYNSSDFSGKEWESPEKEKRLEFLQGRVGGNS